MAEVQLEKVPKVPKGYRCNRKKVFLTYSQCPATCEEIYTHLHAISPIHRYIIAQELHKDGHYHIHAYVEFVEKVDFKNANWADWTGPEKVYHFNDAGAIRDGNCVSKYCTKDNKWISNYYEVSPFAEALHASSLEEGMEIIKTKRPRDYLLYGDRIERNLKRVHFEVPTFPNPMSDMEFYPWQKELIELVKETPVPRTIYWVWSEATGKGKSTFLNYLKWEYRSKLLLASTDEVDTLYSYHDQSIICFDIPRQTPLDAGFTSFLEKLANQGYHLSRKYKSKEKYVKAHLLVFTNRPPPHDKLPGRIKSWCLDSLNELPSTE